MGRTLSAVEGDLKKKDRAKKRMYRFSVRFGWKRRASCLPCLSFGLAMTDEARRQAEM